MRASSVRLAFVVTGRRSTAHSFVTGSAFCSGVSAAAYITADYDMGLSSSERVADEPRHFRNSRLQTHSKRRVPRIVSHRASMGGAFFFPNGSQLRGGSVNNLNTLYGPQRSGNRRPAARLPRRRAELPGQFLPNHPRSCGVHRPGATRTLWSSAAIGRSLVQPVLSVCVLREREF